MVAPTTEEEAEVPAPAPVISDLHASPSVLAARIAWVTDQPSLGRLEYGTSASYGADGGAASGPATSHQAWLVGLEPATTYHYRVSARDTTGVASSTSSGTFVTEPEPEPAPESAQTGIWIGAAELAQLPTSGPAWENLLAQASGPCGVVDLANQDQSNNVCILAKALVYARTGQTLYRTDVVAALVQLVPALLYRGRALALGRELIAYVIAADLIGLDGIDPVLDALFRAAIRALLVVPTTEAGTLRECHESRPNNWGTHCGASRAAVAAYLGDTAELERVAQVFRGWLGEHASYAGFEYGDLAWQCDPTRPVGINPAECWRDGHLLDGVLPDDQRRAGGYVWPAPQEPYVWEALQGALAQAVILHRAGYDVWAWGDRALLRAVTWLHDENGFPAEGDDTWQPHIINHYYGTSFPAPTPAQPGKNVGWTDWTHP